MASQVKNKGFVRVDVYRFMDVKKSNKMTNMQFGNCIGRSDSWVGGVERRGTMHYTDALAFKAYWGVDIMLPDKWEEEEEEPEVKECSEELTAISDKLDRILKVLEKIGGTLEQMEVFS